MSETPPSRALITEAAAELLRRLQARHGALMFHQSGGCCDGSSPMCYPDGDFIVGDRDILLGVLDVSQFAPIIVLASVAGNAADALADLSTELRKPENAEVAAKVGKCWGLGSATAKDPGPWEGELRNMWKPTQQEGLWFHGGNLHQSRHYSLYLALQLKARMEGIPTPVYGLQEVHHLS